MISFHFWYLTVWCRLSLPSFFILILGFKDKEDYLQLSSSHQNVRWLAKRLIYRNRGTQTKEGMRKGTSVF